MSEITKAINNQRNQENHAAKSYVFQIFNSAREIKKLQSAETKHEGRFTRNCERSGGEVS